MLYPHDKFYIERLDHAVKIARATGCDNVGIAFNLCHFLKVQPNDDLATALNGAKDLIWSVSICGADAAGKVAAGASLVQFYTGMIYRGPALIGECVEAIRAANAGRTARSNLASGKTSTL